MQWSPTTSIIVVDAKSLTFLRQLALGLVLRPTDEYAAPATFASNPSRKRGRGAGFANRLLHIVSFLFSSHDRNMKPLASRIVTDSSGHPALPRAETGRRR